LFLVSTIEPINALESPFPQKVPNDAAKIRKKKVITKKKSKKI